MLVATLTQYQFRQFRLLPEGADYDPNYLKLNPKGGVPTLVHDGNRRWNSLVDENDYPMKRWTESTNARCWDIRSSKLPLHQIRYAELAIRKNLPAHEDLSRGRCRSDELSR